MLFLFLACVAAQTDVEPRLLSVSVYPIPLQPTPGYHINPTQHWTEPPTFEHHIYPTMHWTEPPTEMQPTPAYHLNPTMSHWSEPPTFHIKTRRPTPQPTYPARCNYGKPLKNDYGVNYHCGPQGGMCPIGSNCVFLNGYYSCCQCPRFFLDDQVQNSETP
jgi:hypothetical protein